MDLTSYYFDVSLQENIFTVVASVFHNNSTS